MKLVTLFPRLLRAFSALLSPGKWQARVNQPLLSETDIRALFLRRHERHEVRSVKDQASQQSGDRRSVYRGYGLDYEESRPYQPGDEPRYMNWRLSARTGSLQMKVFREERRPDVVILIDRRAAMRFGTRRRLKLTQALRVATMIAAIMAKNEQASVSVLLMDETLRLQGPAVTRSAIVHLLAEVAAMAPPFGSDTEQVSFGQALDFLQEKLVAGSSLYLLSDFIDLSPQHQPQLMALSSRFQLRAHCFYDPAERALPSAGRLIFSSPLAVGRSAANTSSRKVQADYQAAADRHYSRISSIFSALGLGCQMHSTLDEEIPLS